MLYQPATIYLQDIRISSDQSHNSSMKMNNYRLQPKLISPFQVVVDDVFLLENDVFAAPVLDHAQELQRRYDVIGLNS
jgi:hypothetical protein